MKASFLAATALPFAFTGALYLAGSKGISGGTGGTPNLTIRDEDASQSFASTGTLIVGGQRVTQPSANTVRIADWMGGTGTVDSTVSVSQTLVGEYELNSFTLSAGVTLTLSVERALVIKCRSFITINGDINGNAFGALGGAAGTGNSGGDGASGGVGFNRGGGGGGGASSAGACGAGGYGGFGAGSGGVGGNDRDTNGPGLVGTAGTLPGYLSDLGSGYFAMRVGSGGGGGGEGAVNGDGGAGGAGGGLVILEAPTITIASTSTINLNGADGSNAPNDATAEGGGGGGGGGGLLVLRGRVITNSGTQSVTGGTGGTTGAGGGSDGGAGGAGAAGLVLTENLP